MMRETAAARWKQSEKRTRAVLLLFTLLVWAAANPAAAQQELQVQKDIELFSKKPIWVCMTGFTGEAAQVLQFDLFVQGFAFTNADAAQYLISGSNNGNLQGRATDRFNKSSLVSKAYSGASLRRQAHAF